MGAYVHDPNLEQFATARQWELLQALAEHRAERPAAAALGVSKNTICQAKKAVLKRAVKQGYSPEHDFNHIVPDGQKLRGVSTHYGANGEIVGQWVKTAEDRERMLEIIREAVQEMVVDVPKMPKIAAPKGTKSDGMTGYPLSDHHMGMLSWGDETNGDWDIDIASDTLKGAMASLVDHAAPTETALIAILGDYFHYDGFAPVTPKNRNILDAAGRYPRMVSAGTDCLHHAIGLALQKHKRVHVIVELGNHDPSSAIFLMECLKWIFANNPRVIIDTSPKRFHYHEFGNTLIGVNHGDGPKMADLPLIMATDQPEAWGRTEHRYWWTGHTHHDIAKDFRGVKVESFRILAPEDAWSYGEGYRSQQSMQSVTFDATHGEIARHTVNPAMFMERDNGTRRSGHGGKMATSR
jgi:hypothetical protein